MSELPQSWAVTTPVTVAEPIRGVTYKKEQARETAATGFTALLRANNIQQNKLDLSDLVFVPEENVSPNQMLKRHDVVIAMSSGSISVVGKSAQVQDDPNASFGAFCGALRPAQEIEPRYFGHFLKSEAYRSAISNLARGVNINNLKWSHFDEIALPLAPLPEQKRIADKLDTVLARVDACLDRLDRIPALLKRFRQSILATATSGRLTEDWRATNPGQDNQAELEVSAKEIKRTAGVKVRGASIQVEAELLHPLPPSWAWIENHRLAAADSNAICAGPFGTIFKAKDFRDSGVPIIFLRHVGAGEYRTHKPNFMDSAVWKEHHQPYSVFGGELLVTKLGDPPGDACIYPAGIGTAMVTPDVMKMTVDQDVARTEYLMHYFNSPTSKKITESVCFGVTRLRIDLSLFKTFPIPTPPHAEQHEIVRRVETLFAFADRLEARLATARKQAGQLTPALLAKAFRGELVPQDPNDEPATELLKRLTTQREAAPKPKRGRKPAAA